MFLYFRVRIRVRARVRARVRVLLACVVPVSGPASISCLFLVFCSIFTKGIFHCRQLVCEIDLKAAENAVNVRSFFINSCR